VSKSRRLPSTFRTLFNLFMAGAVAFSFLLPVSEALAGPRRDDPPPDGSIPASNIPGWLDMSTSADQIYSEYPLETLAGKLILYGVTSAPDCPNGGLLDDSLASKCGVQATLPEVIKWQNRFNSAIIAASQQTGVPPVMLKNVFAWESQFWPNTVFVNTSEYGLGHLTEMGADSVLRWNYAFYQSTCHDSFSSENCDKFYVDQPLAIQSALRGVVLQKVNADCGNCNYGLDLQKAEDSIPTFATTLLANQRLVKIYIQWFTGKKAADVVGDGDLWRFTLASYNAGPGCFKSALAKTYYAGKPINWDTLSSNFDPACRGANAYVDFVSNNAQYFPDHAPSTLPTPAATAVPLETITDAPTVSATPEVTSTPEGTVSPTAGSTDTQTVSPTATAETTDSVAVTVAPTIELPSASPTLTITETATSTVELPSDTPTATATETTTPEPPTATPTPTSTPTEIIVGLPTEIPQGGGSSSELVVKFKDFPASLFSSLVLSSVGATVEQTMDPLGAVVVSVPDGQAAAVLDQLNNNLLVDYAEPNSSVQVFYTPNDPGFAQQSNALSAMQIPEAWDLTQGNGALVAVIDTGVDTIHTDLNGALWTNPGETGIDANGNDKRTNSIDDDNDGYVDDWQGWNFVDNSNHPGDDNGHGTHLAGIIAGRMDNNEGMAGIAPQAQVMALKALDANGHGTYATVAAAIYYAVDHGARIINLGFGGTDSSQALLDATNYAFDHGALVIAAGGNTGDGTVFYPAANPNVMAVSALDGSLNPALFSSFNDNISLSAPGVNVFSTLPGSQYGPLSGTSMSAAEVSGVAALLAGLPKFDTTAAIREALIGGAFDLGNSGWDANYGYGLVHALDAINYVPGQTPTPTTPPTPDASPTPTTIPGDGGVDIMVDAANASIVNYTPSCSTVTYNTQLTGTDVSITGNNVVSGAINLPFDFWYLGTRYTQVYVSSNGWMSFGNPNGNSYAANNLGTGGNTAGQIARPLLAPFWDNLNVGGNATSARYATGTDSLGDPTLIFEWWNTKWGNNGSTARISFRVVLHSKTGVIDYLYYNNNAANPNGASASIGLTATGTGTNTTPPSFKRVSDITCAANPWWNNGTVNDPANLAARPSTGQVFTFTPPVPNAPTMLAPTNVTTTSETLNWTDNSINENGFVIYTSTDGINYTFVAQTAANATSFNATGLANSANNYWRIYSVTEGALSAQAAQLNAPSGLTFSNVKTTSMTLNWVDNASNETGYLIYRSTDGINYSFVIQTAVDATTYNANGLTAGTTYYWRVLALNTGAALSAAATGTRTANTLPVVTITGPANNSTYAKNTPITFTGTAIDAQDGNISAGLVWYSNLTGPIGTGFTVTASAMLPGTHIITAKSTDSNGESSSVSITVTVTPLKGPHGDFTATTDQCALCHRDHSAQGAGYLTTDPNSVTASDTFCLNCHPGVSTHSNTNWGSAVEPHFEIRCIQCHDPHGNSNLFAVNTGIVTNLSASTVVSPVTFTAMTGSNSFDDGTSTNRLCVVCHTATTNHSGGASHYDSTTSTYTLDYTGQSCVACHPHNADTSAVTLDGFMPVRNSNP
jgi:thermitase